MGCEGSIRRSPVRRATALPACLGPWHGRGPCSEGHLLRHGLSGGGPVESVATGRMGKQKKTRRGFLCSVRFVFRLDHPPSIGSERGRSNEVSSEGRVCSRASSRWGSQGRRGRRWPRVTRQAGRPGADSAARMIQCPPRGRGHIGDETSRPRWSGQLERLIDEIRVRRSPEFAESRTSSTLLRPRAQ